jgi:HEAT repeat protein
MTDDEWSKLVADLKSIEDGGDLDVALNASLRLSTIDDPDRLADLKALAEDGHFFVLEAVVPAIADLDGLNSLPFLLQALERCHAQGHDGDGVAFSIVELIELSGEAAIPILTAMLTSQDANARRDGAWLLGFVATFASPTPLLELTRDTNPEVRVAAIGSLSPFADRFDVFDHIASCATDSDEAVRVAVASAVGFIADRRAMDLLRTMLIDPSAEVRRMAEYSVTRIEHGT